MTAQAPRLVLRDKVVDLSRCQVMAIVNRTPDSFYDGGRTFGLSEALDRVEQVVAEGAAIVDVGGVKAAPGEDVPVAEEMRRVVELVAAIRERHPALPISVDTYRSEVADEACRAGADLVNDAWQAPDPRTAEVAASYGAGLVCTHAGHLPPRTRPHRVQYDDLVGDVVTTLEDLVRRALSAGVARDSLLVDPGHDFGKSSRHSLALTAAADRLTAVGPPVLMALSRKSFLGEVLDLPVDQRLEASLAATAIGAWLGARVFRAHDVAPTVRALSVVDAIAGRRDLAVGRRGLA